jgi:hypothetical protein
VPDQQRSSFSVEGRNAVQALLAVILLQLDASLLVAFHKPGLHRIDRLDFLADHEEVGCEKVKGKLRSTFDPELPGFDDEFVCVKGCNPRHADTQQKRDTASSLVKPFILIPSFPTKY